MIEIMEFLKLVQREIQWHNERKKQLLSVAIDADSIKVDVIFKSGDRCSRHVDGCTEVSNLEFAYLAAMYSRVMLLLADLEHVCENCEAFNNCEEPCTKGMLSVYYREWKDGKL